MPTTRQAPSDQPAATRVKNGKVAPVAARTANDERRITVLIMATRGLQAVCKEPPRGNIWIYVETFVVIVAVGII